MIAGNLERNGDMVFRLTTVPEHERYLRYLVPQVLVRLSRREIKRNAKSGTIDALLRARLDLARAQWNAMAPAEWRAA